jgi:hypothetical protein
MAIGKTAGFVIAAALWASAAQFPARHEHINGHCNGVFTVDENGVAFRGAGDHAWSWSFEDIQELKLFPNRVEVLTYKDDWKRLWRDRRYVFSGTVPVEELAPLFSARMDQRFVLASAPAGPVGEWEIPAKHRTRFSGSEGTLVFAPESIFYSTRAKGESRTWRFSDIDSISSSGPFQLTVTTFERAMSHYGDRKDFNFDLKQPITEARYNQLWLQIEKKNGRIQ